MTFRSVGALLVATCLGPAPAKAEPNIWVCSIIQRGTPQIIKYMIKDDLVWVSTSGSRLIAQYIEGSGYSYSLKIMEDTEDGLVAVGRGTPASNGEPSDYSSRVLIINKRKGASSDTELSTLNAPVEVKGNCTN